MHPSFILPLAATLAIGTPALAAEALTDVPAAFAVQGRDVLLTVQGIGAQIYACQAKADGTLAWMFREPIATLVQGGRTVGRHYAGPTWDVGDGDLTGKLIASAPGATADDIPQLELQVTGHHGAGPLGAAQMVLRLGTVGGVLAGPCDRAGELRSVPYRADYVFLK